MSSVKLLGRPILLRAIDGAAEAGVTQVTIVVGYQAGRVRALPMRCDIDTVSDLAAAESALTAGAAA